MKIETEAGGEGRRKCPLNTHSFSRKKAEEKASQPIRREGGHRDSQNRNALSSEAELALMIDITF